MAFNSRVGADYFRPGILLMVGFAILCSGAVTAHASVIVSAQSATANPGSSGNTFDVELSNTGPSSVSVAAFTFGILTTNVDISFTDANISTAAAYIFAGNSLFGPDLTGPTSGHSLTTSDVFAIPFTGVALAPGTTVGLGHILFDVSPGAGAGTFPVVLQPFATTSLSDPTGANIDIDTLTPGEITITGTATPEPSSMLMIFAGITLVAGTARIRHRSGRQQSPYLSKANEL